MLCVRAVAKVMAAQEERSYQSRRFGERSLGRGSIVNLGSANSHVGAPGMMSYVASKHAIIGITKTAGALVLNPFLTACHPFRRLLVLIAPCHAALDLSSSHIRVNTVCPSWVDTPMMEASLKRVPQLDAMLKAVTPLKRAAVPEEARSTSSSYVAQVEVTSTEQRLSLTPGRR